MAAVRPGTRINKSSRREEFTSAQNGFGLIFRRSEIKSAVKTKTWSRKLLEAPLRVFIETALSPRPLFRLTATISPRAFLLRRRARELETATVDSHGRLMRGRTGVRQRVYWNPRTVCVLTLRSSGECDHDTAVRSLKSAPILNCVYTTWFSSRSE